jgi:hypothetical protein
MTHQTAYNWYIHDTKGRALRFLEIIQLITMYDELVTLPHFKFPLRCPCSMRNHRSGRVTKSICFKSGDKDRQKYLWPS